jgi:hypothetical protein
VQAASTLRTQLIQEIRMCRPLVLAALLATALALPACGSVASRNLTLSLTGVTIGSQTPSSVIRQVYYLGVFDPRDQLPPTIYRIRVQGQASALALTKFASGWVRAELVDSLSGQVALPGDRPTPADKPAVEQVNVGFGGHRLVMFGPEGFREAPRDHRLVVVMGANPEGFFAAVDQALGVVAQVTQGAQAGPEIEKALSSDLARNRLLRQQVDLVLDAVHAD